MMRKAALIALAAAVAGGLTAASAGAAAAVLRTACARPAVVGVKSFAFRPAKVRPGKASTATLTAVNCTGRTQHLIEAWFGQFTLPGGGVPPSCPVMDPIEFPVRFPPHHTVSTPFSALVLPSCTASRLTITVDIDDQNFNVLATGTAILKIIQGPCAARAIPRR